MSNTVLTSATSATAKSHDLAYAELRLDVTQRRLEAIAGLRTAVNNEALFGFTILAAFLGAAATAFGLMVGHVNVHHVSSIVKAAALVGAILFALLFLVFVALAAERLHDMLEDQLEDGTPTGFLSPESIAATKRDDFLAAARSLDAATLESALFTQLHAEATIAATKLHAREKAFVYLGAAITSCVIGACFAIALLNR